VRKLVTRLVIPVIVVLVLLVILDRGSLALAQRSASSRLADYGQFQSKPAVKIHGFPFLTQAAKGKFDDVEVTSDSATVGAIKNAALDVHLHGVSIPVGKLVNGKVNSLPVDRVDGTVGITYAELARLSSVSGLTFTRSGDFVQITGTPKLTGSTTVGQVNALAAVSVVAGALHVTARSLKINGKDVTGATLAGVTGLLSSALVLPALPYGLKLKSVQATDTGLAVIGAAPKVVLTPP
jgi:hypothetical protein